MTEENSAREMKELYPVFHQEYIIMAEYRMLQTENLHGIYVIPSYENSLTLVTAHPGMLHLKEIFVDSNCYGDNASVFFVAVWYGVIFVRSGIYEGGIFRFTLTLPENFPDDKVPVLKFTSQLYHPAVDPNTGVLSLNEVFPQWDRKQNHIWQILKYLHWVFHNLNMKAPANLEASVNFKTNKKLFIEKAKESVTESVDHVYDNPPTEDKHYITFKPYDPNIHETAKNIMLKSPALNESSQGFSWVQQGSFESFSKEGET